MLKLGTFEITPDNEIVDCLKKKYDIPEEIANNAVVVYRSIIDNNAFAIALHDNKFKVAAADHLEFNMITSHAEVNRAGITDISNFLYDPDIIYVSDEDIDKVIEFLENNYLNK